MYFANFAYSLLKTYSQEPGDVRNLPVFYLSLLICQLKIILYFSLYSYFSFFKVKQS